MTNAYLIEALVRERLEEARSWAMRAALVAHVAPTPGWLRALVGGLLIRVGHAVAGQRLREARDPDRATA